MTSNIKLAVTMGLLLSASIANAAFVNTTTGSAYGYGSYDETANKAYLVVRSESKSGGSSYTELVDTFATSGVFSFDWNMSSNEIGRGGYLLNGTKFELGSFNGGFNSANGSTSVLLAAGDTFGWYLEGTFRADVGLVDFNISNARFTASPSAVPVPAAAWLFGSGLLGFASLRRKHA